MLEVDIEVPPHLMDHFEEFCPLFVTCSIPTEAIGDTMQQFIEEKKLSKLPRRQLVAGRKARWILLTTPLLKWYLEHGLVITKVVKEGLLDKFKSKLYDHCEDDWQLDFAEHYFPRQCCAAHNQYDQKTPGLFKLEKSGTGIVGLCSKTYCLQAIGSQEKIAVKGVNKANLGSDVYNRTFDVLQTGQDKLAVN